MVIVSPEQILASIRGEQPDRPGNRGRRAHRTPAAPLSPALPALLTDYEKWMLGRIADGLSNAGIAFEKNLSEDTVKSQVRVLFKKLQAGSRAQAVHHAHQRGLLT